MAIDSVFRTVEFLPIQAVDRINNPLKGCSVVTHVEQPPEVQWSIEKPDTEAENRKQTGYNRPEKYCYFDWGCSSNEVTPRLGTEG